MEQSGRNAKILIVEDTLTTIDMLKLTLQESGYEIDLATTGEKALAKAVETLPDLILLDVVLPGMDGFETCRRLKERPGTREIPVIFMTALSAIQDKVTAFAVGGVDYVNKPLELEDVLARVRTHLALRRMQLALEWRNRQLQQEIAERKQIENALKESEAQKRAILDASIDRIRYVDRQMKIIWANKTTTADTGLTPEALVGKTCYRLMLARNAPCDGCPMVKSLQTGQTERTIMHYPAIRAVAGESYWDTYCIPLKVGDNESPRFIQIAREITELKQAEAQIRGLSQELMKAQESERRHVSCELHDHAAQDLAALKIGLDTLFDQYPQTPAELRRKVAVYSDALKDIIVDVRDLAYGLRPSILDHLGLARTIEQYGEDFMSRTGIHVKFIANGMQDKRLAPETEINIYRLIQDRLSHIAKQGQAQRVRIHLGKSLQQIVLGIDDDCDGCKDPDLSRPTDGDRQSALDNLEQRVGLLGGSMRVQSYPGHGSRLIIEIPCAGEETIG
jgi:PAS domain S-box-containing protein